MSDTKKHTMSSVTPAFLKPITQSNPESTIYLVDASGSTKTSANFGDGLPVIQKMLQIVEQQNTETVERDIMFWSNTSILHSNMQTDQETMWIELQSWNGKFGGTHLVPAIQTLQTSGKKYDCVEIITDGQINDDQYNVVNSLKQFIATNPNVILNIRTVTNKTTDYTQELTNVADKLYGIITSCDCAKLVQKYILHSPNHQSGFVNLFNAKLGEQQIQFGDNYFEQNDLPLFMEYLQEQVGTITKNASNASYASSEAEFIQLTNTLLTTISCLTKGKTKVMKTGIINMFHSTLLFDGCPQYVEIAVEHMVSTLFENENANEITFQNYIANRNKLFERTQMGLMENFAQSFKSSMFSHVDFYAIVPDKTNRKLNILLTDLNKSSQFTATAQYGFDKYVNSAISIDDYVYPVLPLNFKRTKHVEQAIRQWVRKVYGQRFGISGESEVLMYLFLTDMYRIITTPNVPENVVASMRSIAMTMLNRNRFNTNIKEIDFLLSGNPPTSLLGSIDDAKQFLAQSANIFGLSLSAYELWYNILLSLGNEQLMDAQQHVFDADTTTAAVLPSPSTFLDATVIDLRIGNRDAEYTCIYTLESTAETGGYMIGEHFQNSFRCSPKIVICQESYDKIVADNAFSCPFCRMQLDTTILHNIPPQNNQIHQPVDLLGFSHDENCKTKHDIIDLSAPLNASTSFKIVDACDFSAKSFDVVGGQVFIHPLNRKQIVNKTTENIANFINTHYPFLNHIGSIAEEFGFAICGGFCTKLLLGDTKVNDIDIFLTKIVEPNAIIQIINEIESAVLGFDATLHSLFAYKNNTNVIDIIFHKDSNIMFKFQIILIKHTDILQVMNDFDLGACCAFYRNGALFLTEKCENAMQHMMNTVDMNLSSSIYDKRLLKYFNTGFAIGVKNTLTNKIKNERQHRTNNINYCDTIEFDCINIDKNAVNGGGDENASGTVPLYPCAEYDSIESIKKLAEKYPENVTLFAKTDIKLADNAFLVVGDKVIEKLIDVDELYYLNTNGEKQLWKESHEIVDVK